ncbi:AtpZ/AtpI family protein [Sphingomonas sp. CA1-15]|uniref:AtpZ/AtpI family protein n=1 Tax=Sphingomonas immobilis TaxID=3063997 RepID=A0ABT8ZZG8_9SPHN|nr:AtpZ/AtpI family protein [Sphingomonas sp. CA1-15]MDO7842597.1 AtpZ/AtpI family protein [Sphingomonas sp. CA1-15]
MAELRHNDDLDDRIAQAKAADEARAAKTPVKPQPKGYAQGSRVLMELIGAPLGGGVIGYAIDYWAGTKPWAMLILIVLSVIVAFRNIYRISKERAE